MPFTLASQCKRFDEEKRKLKKVFGKWVAFEELTDRAQIELRFTTTKNNFYILRCYLEVDFPNSMPALVVCYPDKPLTDRDGIPLGISSENHCLGYKRYGLTQICHCRPERWDKNFKQVLSKGILWLEAYERLIETGESISTQLPEMPVSEEMQAKLAKLDEMIEMNCQNPQEVFAALILLMPTLIYI